MTKKDFREIYLLGLLAVFISALWLLYGIYLKKAEIHIIKDPIVIYDNMRAEPLDRRGVIGIVSEKELKEMIGVKDEVPFK